MMRFPQARERLNEDDFRTQVARQVFKRCCSTSASRSIPTIGEDAIDEQARRSASRARAIAEAEDAKELSEWVKATLKRGGHRAAS